MLGVFTKKRYAFAGVTLVSSLFLFGWLMRKSGCKAQEVELNNLKRMLESR